MTMTNDEALLPCPWCGETMRLPPSVTEGSTFRWRKVDGCCGDGPEVRHDTMAEDQSAAEVESRAAAIAAWNERAPAIAALSAQADTKQAEPCPWVRQSSEGTAYCELAESGAKQAEPLSPWLQALATVNRLHNLGDAIYDVRRYASENDSEYTGSSWEHPDVLAYSAAVKVLNAALATLPAPPALHQLGAKVEVSDG